MVDNLRYNLAMFESILAKMTANLEQLDHRNAPVSTPPLAPSAARANYNETRCPSMSSTATPMTQMADARTDKLIAARRQVSRDKRAHTLQTLLRLAESGARISFARLAREAGVSTWLLYNSPELKQAVTMRCGANPAPSTNRRIPRRRRPRRARACAPTSNLLATKSRHYADQNKCCANDYNEPSAPRSSRSTDPNSSPASPN